MHGTVLLGPDEGRTFAIASPTGGREFQQPAFAKRSDGSVAKLVRVYQWRELHHEGIGLVRAGWVFEKEVEG